MIIYGLLTESDIGKLFISGIIPGIIGVLFYLLAITIYVHLYPHNAPKTKRSLPLKRSDITGVIAVTTLFLVIIIGIYGGIFTPTEAAGVGALISLLLSAARGKLTLKNFYDACLDTAQTTAMIFALVIGAEIFSNFINFAGLPDALLIWISGLDVGPFVVVFIILLIYILLGAVLESLSMILLTVPIFYPLVLSLDFGNSFLASEFSVTVWFGILVIVVTEISLISPPIGLNVFVLRSVLNDVPLATIFKGIFPFWIADLLRLSLLFLFPIFSVFFIHSP